MAANKNPYRTFPTPVEGPKVPYKAAQESNPILRGRVLEIAATLSVHPHVCYGRRFYVLAWAAFAGN